MSDREMIIDLLRDVQAIGFWVCGVDQDTGQPDGYNMGPKWIADYLLENGVTIRAAVPGHCDQHNIAEMAYNNGMEAGKPKWIPVAERLPEQGQEVIVYSGNVLKPCVYGVHYWNKEFNSWAHITHWMPLPEPPKEDTHE